MGLNRVRGEYVKLLGALALISLSCGCEKTPHEHLADARQHLAAAAYLDAIADAEVGLLGESSDATAWGLEIVKLEALARAGMAEEAKAQLEKLAGLYPKRIPASEYSATAHQLDSAGQGPAAIEVLDLGLKRYPDDPVIARMIGSAASGSGGPDSAELDMLRSLGYIE
jgi:tetratricopeptide (TPR) repeat protein